MDQLALALPSERYRRSYLESDREFVAEGPIAEGKFIATDETFAKMLADLDGVRTGARIPGGFVQMLELWLVASDRYLGKVQIRGGALAELGGRDHFGVALRPSCRGRGLARRAIELARPHVVALGIDPVFVMCRASNAAARRLVAHYGGVLDAELPGADPSLRFRVPLEAAHT